MPAERLWLVFNTVFACAAAMYAVILRSLQQSATGFDFFMTGRGEAAIYTLCGIVLLVNLGFIIYRLAMIDRKLVFRNQDGEITISLLAVETALSQAASTLEDLHSCKVKIRIPPSGKGPIRIDALGVINSVSDVRELTQKIQALIKMKLTEMLQLEGDLLFNVHFTKAAEKRQTRADDQSFDKRRFGGGQARERLVDPEAAFPIKYPVDHDDGM